MKKLSSIVFVIAYQQRLLEISILSVLQLYSPDAAPNGCNVTFFPSNNIKFAVTCWYIWRARNYFMSNNQDWSC